MNTLQVRQVDLFVAAKATLLDHPQLWKWNSWSRLVISLCPSNHYAQGTWDCVVIISWDRERWLFHAKEGGFTLSLETSFFLDGQKLIHYNNVLGDSAGRRVLSTKLWVDVNIGVLVPKGHDLSYLDFNNWPRLVFLFIFKSNAWSRGWTCAVLCQGNFNLFH